MRESQTIELKQIWKDEYLKTICAFANTDGGEMYIGICDDGKVVGVQNKDVFLETLPNKINNRLGLLVDVVNDSVDGKDIIKITVAKTYAPVSFNGKFFTKEAEAILSS